MAREQPKAFSLNGEQALEFDKGHPILDSIADGVFTVDQDKRITSFNRAAEEITGFTREEAIGRRCSEVFNASICQRECALQRTIETGQRLVNVPVEIKQRSGATIPISISTAVLCDREGNHIGGVETFRDLTALAELRKQIDDRYGLKDIVGRHPRMKEILEIIPEVASSDATVLIQGASGSGKGLLAKAIHDLSGRRDQPFVKVNCAALPETLLESELFGYLKGAFTDAKRDKPGRIALAEGGTLFLDEIGDVPPSVQVKLLRVVQEREYEPLGATTTRVADVRVIAATNRDLERLMEQGAFREDLYYRLNIVGLELPTLAERREDIPRLVDRFLQRFNAKMGKYVTSVTEEAMELLMHHDYPGNVRELENAIEHALVLCRGSVIEERHLPATVRQRRQIRAPAAGDPLQSAEAQTIRATLERFGGNRVAAAQALGLHRTTLWRKMRRYGLD
jgi:PAS domain S-box-containing protein